MGTPLGPKHVTSFGAQDLVGSQGFGPPLGYGIQENHGSHNLPASGV